MKTATIHILPQEYAAIAYECIESPHSPEVSTVIFNYPRSMQLTREVKQNAFNRHSGFWLSLHVKRTNTSTHFPQVLYMYEKDVVEILATLFKTCHLGTCCLSILPTGFEDPADDKRFI